MRFLDKYLQRLGIMEKDIWEMFHLCCIALFIYLLKQNYTIVFITNPKSMDETYNNKM